MIFSRFSENHWPYGWLENRNPRSEKGSVKPLVREGKSLATHPNPLAGLESTCGPAGNDKSGEEYSGGGSGDLENPGGEIRSRVVAQKARVLTSSFPSRLHSEEKRKASGGLGIPTMKDRAMQALYLLALIPVSEEAADPNSYGFRPFRSTVDAIVQCFNVLACAPFRSRPERTHALLREGSALGHPPSG